MHRSFWEHFPIRTVWNFLRNRPFCMGCERELRADCRTITTSEILSRFRHMRAYWKGILINNQMESRLEWNEMLFSFESRARFFAPFSTYSRTAIPRTRWLNTIRWSLWDVFGSNGTFSGCRADLNLSFIFKKQPSVHALVLFPILSFLKSWASLDYFLTSNFHQHCD